MGNTVINVNGVNLQLKEYDGKRFVKGSELRIAIGGVFTKKAPNVAGTMEISLGQLWEIENTSNRVGNPNMPVRIYFEEYFQNVDSDKFTLKTKAKIHELIESYFHYKDPANVCPEMTISMPTSDNYRGLDRETFLEGMKMLSAAILSVNTRLDKVTELLAKADVPAAGTAIEIPESPKTEKDKILEKKKYIANTPLTGFQKWKNEVFHSITGKTYKEQLAILEQTYKYMTQKYGIVWDQERKEYKEKYDNQSVTTLELAYELEQKNVANKNLLKTCLESVLSADVDETLSKEDPNFSISNVTEIDEKFSLIAQVLLKDEKSLREEYCNMVYSDQTLKWGRLLRDYRRAHGLPQSRPVSVFAVLDSTATGRRRGISLYSNFLREKGLK